MKVGDLVWYIFSGVEPMMGIITKVGSINEYYTVKWLDGSSSSNMIDSELEVV
tara:strand:+ start:709 stop:867 length:159 start_codon:yes stop_codon:yes gene_type:complete